MVVVEQKRFKGQDGKPTHPKWIKLLNEGKDLSEIPHRYYFPENVLKNLIRVKRSVLKNKEQYIKSGGGNKMTSSVIIIAGKSNSGKSTLASQIGLFFDPKITLENNYAWNMQRLLEITKDTYPGQVIIMDEAMVINTRSANSTDNLKIIIALSQIRSKGVFFIFNINSVHQLEKTIPLTRADFLIRIKRIGGIDGIPKYCIYDENKMREIIIKNSGKYSYSGVYPNIEWTTFSKYFPFDDIRYDKIKHEESLKNLEGKEKANHFDKYYKLALVKLVEYCKVNKLITTYEDMCFITDIKASKLSRYKKDLYQQLKDIDFKELYQKINNREDRREPERRKICKICNARLSAKNRTGLCAKCYIEDRKKRREKERPSSCKVCNKKLSLQNRSGFCLDCYIEDRKKRIEETLIKCNGCSKKISHKNRSGFCMDCYIKNISKDSKKKPEEKMNQEIENK